MDRPLSSDLVSGTTEQRRIRVALKAIETDPHLLQRTFYQALGFVDSAVLQREEFVHLADGWTNDGDADVCFLAKCVVALAISRLGNHGIDDRWSGIVERRLNWSQSHLSEYRGRRDSVNLRNFVQIALELNSAHPDYDDLMARMIFHNTSSAARQLRVENASIQPRRGFMRAVEPARGPDAGPGRETERDGHPLSHPRALHYFARGHRIEMFCVFGATT